jgi:hypothetical protein
MIYRDKPNIEGYKFKGGIMYSPSRANDAEILKQKINELGYEMNTLQISHLSHPRFVANKNEVTIEFYNYLQKKLPEIQDMQFIYDPTEMFSLGCDFTIILAEQ